METIELPSRGLGLHFGPSNTIKDFSGSWFKSSVNGSVLARITSINWRPSDIYNTTDGYAGNCWEATVMDFRDGNKKDFLYKFRNLADLIEYYKDFGSIFIDERY